MPKDFIGAEIIRFVEVDSTNRIALVGNYQNGAIIIAEVQTAGKGRRGRVWSSAKGGLYLSIFLKDLDRLIEYQMAAILSAFTVAEVCREFYSDGRFLLKWPNDVYFEDRKICGVLAQTEVSGDANRGAIGIGVNLNIASFAQELSDKAISLNMLCRSEIDIEKFETSLISALKLKLFPPIQTAFSNMLPKINKLLYKKGERAFLYIGDETCEYCISGIDEDCNLLAFDSSGQAVKISIGEFI